jgi:K+-sensing histidine kinase KdpD
VGQKRPDDVLVAVDGVGLGLAIVQAIANARDATVTAQVRTSGGLGFKVAFPALS